MKVLVSTFLVVGILFQAVSTGWFRAWRETDFIASAAQAALPADQKDCQFSGEPYSLR